MRSEGVRKNNDGISSGVLVGKSFRHANDDLSGGRKILTEKRGGRKSWRNA